MSKSARSGERLAGLTRRMRDDIRFGAFSFGQWLKLIDLQKRYRATQFEIRRVLDALKAERLVEHRVNHGFRVATPDPTERRQMQFVRTILERSTAALIAARATPADIDALQDLAQSFDRSVELQGRQLQATANSAFHQRLYALAGNPILSGLIHELRERSHYGTTGRWRSAEGLHESSVEHFLMVEAIRRRDPIELDRLIVRHIEAF
jgi:DNA-binding GntR family transcriptional regulator